MCYEPSAEYFCVNLNEILQFLLLFFLSKNRLNFFHELCCLWLTQFLLVYIDYFLSSSALSYPQIEPLAVNA